MQSSSVVPDPFLVPTAVRPWTGGVVRPRHLQHAGKPMRVAAWITSSGDLLAAAIVEGHGPTVLRELLDETLARVRDDERPDRLVVWPSVRAAFREVEFPAVTVMRDEFLTVVIEDQADFGFIPGDLPVRRGIKPRTK